MRLMNAKGKTTQAFFFSAENRLGAERVKMRNADAH